MAIMCPKSKLFLPGTCCFTAVDFLDIFVVFSNGVINEGRGRGNEGWRQPRIITAWKQEVGGHESQDSG